MFEVIFILVMFLLSSISIVIGTLLIVGMLWDVYADSTGKHERLVILGSPIVRDDYKDAIYLDLLKNLSGKKETLIVNEETGHTTTLLENLANDGVAYYVKSCCFGLVGVVYLDWEAFYESN